MAGEFDPTERLDEVVVDSTDELPLAGKSLDVTEGRRRFGSRKPLDGESGYENNGSPLVWLAIAAVLLLGAVVAIVAVGQRDNDGAADNDGTADGDVDVDVDVDANIGDDLSDEAGPPGTPLVGDPSASATDDFNVTTTDTSPPDEAADDESVTTNPEADAPTSTSSAVVADGELIIGDAVITVTANDFEIALSTSSCTTIEWSFAGEGQSNAYDSGTDCFDEHLLSPRPEDPLLPATSYEVTASFVADGVRQVAAFTVVTASG